MNIKENLKFDNIIDNFKNTFFRAVVENRKDPKKLGRVQVRILGIHPDDIQKVPTKSLPWAEVIVPNVHQGQMSGIGNSTVPLEGSWVWVFLENGDFNKPIVVGMINGISQRVNPGGKNSGFWDQNKKYPIKERLNEPDINRLARNEKFSETLIKKVKDAKRTKGIPTAAGSTWDEPKESSSKAKYPDNTVIETQTGNIIEYDDTAGNSRIHFFHNTGTYWEMTNLGDFASKVVRDKFTIVNRDFKELIKRNHTQTINKNKEEKIGKDETVNVGGNRKETVKGNETFLTKGTRNETVKGAVTEKYASGQKTDGGPQIKIKAGVILLN